MKKMSVMKKITITAVGVLLIVILGYFGYKLVHYKLYDGYKDYISEHPEYEEGTPFQAVSASHTIDGMEAAAENEALILYINAKTAETAVYDKRSGQTIYSNPLEAEQDSVASKTNKSYLQSQMIVDFFNSNRKSTTYNSYDYCTSLGQFTIESIGNGIRVIYTIGDLSSSTGIVPEYITSERLESFLAKISDKDAKYVRNRYLESGEEGVLKLNEKAMEGKATMNKINSYLTEAGYTEADYIADMEAAGVEDATPISFEIPLEYRLCEDSLEVSVPSEHIVENGGGKLYRVQLLRYFGAAGTQENGYILVPNGSGSLIRFNNGKIEALDYSQSVYGMDPLAESYVVLENEEKARLPLFGLYREDSKTGIFATIEQGESNASIYASVAGIVNSYNYAYPVFTLRGYDKLAMFGTTGNEADLPIVEERLYDTPIVMKYTFLTKEYEGYSGMANYYRERLLREGVLTAKETAGAIPFYTDVIGGVKRTAYFLGAQYLQVFPMTTYEEASKILDQLSESGVNRVVMNYQGWFNGGYYHDVANKISLVGKLGSKKELERLAEKLEAQSGKLYGDVAFQQVTYISKRYDETRETSRYYGGGYIAAFGQTSPVTLSQTASLGYRETIYNLISPKFLDRYVKKFTDKIEAYDITGISLRDLGDVLHPDKKRTEIILREEAKEIVKAQFEKLAATGKDLMVSGGNAYALGYADDLLNIPLNGNSYLILDEEVPFYEMVIHGCINYAGTAINTDASFNYQDTLLSLIETGASPHFTFTWEDSSEMKYTGLNRFYSTTFDTWKEVATSLYQEVNQVLSKVEGSFILEHKRLDSGVVKMTYSNGAVIYINRQASAAQADGILLDAGSYKIVTKEAAR